MTPQTEDPNDAAELPVIVGIGASAGGLEAIHGFLESLPERHKLVIVIIQHLDPDHDSLMQELLAKRTTSPVVTTYNGCPAEEGHIYLIAPGELLTIRDNHFVTEKYSQPRGVRRPIDVFLTSLALHSGINSIAVILSGTGSDGSQGISDIRSHGGLVLAQTPDEAKYDGMPRAAIATGACDRVVEVDQVFPVIEDFFSRVGDLTSEGMTDGEFLARVTRHLRNRTGHDFSEYKAGTMLRRIAVRMSVLGVTHPWEYLRLLVEDPLEADALFEHVLINVTSFFRDTHVFDALRKTHIPELIRKAGPDSELRFWVAGCSTGEEAYSIAILIRDEMEKQNCWPHAAIFATDIDGDALRQARRGVYGRSIAEVVPPATLQKHFQHHKDGYAVSETLRNMVRVSEHSLIADPPFSQIDVVTCRNVLIYFEKPLQTSVIKAFQYALKDNGLLILGNSEAISNSKEMFQDISPAHRVFQRRPGPAARLELRPSGGQAHGPPRPPVVGAPPVMPPYAAEVLNTFAPPYMVLSEHGDLVYASSNATRFLQVAAGRPQLSILTLVRPDLRPALARLLRVRQKPGETQSVDVHDEDNPNTLTMRIKSRGIADGQILLAFDVSGGPGHAAHDTQDITDGSAHYQKELENELDAARDHLRTTLAELETSSEELKSSNEEMMSMNEELQSANEELTTTNDELNSKIAEIRDANADMDSFIRSTMISTIFLDADMNLRRFTPEARNQFRFVESDIGRPLDDIGSELDVAEILADCKSVVKSEVMKEAEYESRDGKSYRARIVPFKDEDAATGGVVLSIFDVTELRHFARVADEQRTMSEQRLAEIEDLYKISPQAMGVVGTDLNFIRVNQRMADIAGRPIENLLGDDIGSFAPSIRKTIKTLAQEVLDTREPIEDRRLYSNLSNDPAVEKVWEADWYPVFDGGKVSGVGLNVRDITEQVRLQFELRRIMQELQHRVKNMLANVLALVSRASRDAMSDRAVFDALAKRIQALAQTHKLLTQSNWSSASLSNILKPELTLVYGEDRVQLKGPEITVNARSALSLGMAVHELATNAAKYGAFANPDGSVRLSWLRQDDGESDVYIFTWKETGGPPLDAPQKGGFGSQLIKSTISGSLNGKVEFFWEPDGLCCVMTLPVNALIEIPNESLFNALDI